MTLKSFREKLAGVFKTTADWFTFLAFMAVILVCAGALSVGPFYWAICAIAGLIAGITLGTSYLGGWKTSATIGLAVLVSKGISVLLYRKDSLMDLQLHVADFIVGGILFATVFLWVSGLWKSLREWMIAHEAHSIYFASGVFFAGSIWAAVIRLQNPGAWPSVLIISMPVMILVLLVAHDSPVFSSLIWGIFLMSVTCLIMACLVEYNTPESKAKRAQKAVVLAYAQKSAGTSVKSQAEDVGMWFVVGRPESDKESPLIFFRATSPDQKMERWIQFSPYSCPSSPSDGWPEPGRKIRVLRQRISAGPDWQIAPGSSQIIYVAGGCALIN
jgi:hypothetical protein